MVVLNRENLLLDCEAASREEAIRLLAARLEQGGYTDAGYVDAVLEREQAYPTGLPTDDVPTALPHASYPGVAKTGVGVARLKRPVAFRSMDGSEAPLDVSLIFLLANASGSDGHLADLQELMSCFCREGLLKDLMAAGDEDEFLRIFERRMEYQEA